MNPLPFVKKVRVISSLVDGCSIRTTERLCEVHRDTIMHLGLSIGEACVRLHDGLMQHLHVGVLQLDEIWSYVNKKQRHLAPGDNPEWGDQYTYIGLDANNKAIVSFLVGKRDGDTTNAFALDLRRRILNRPQITTDGYEPYVEAVEQAFGADVDYATMVKEKGSAARLTTIAGNPNQRLISTSFVERQNLTMRMAIRRFMRKTNAFSKKLRNHRAAVALHVAHYDFCRVHESLRITPAMALGVTDHVWSVAGLIEAAMSIAHPTGEEYEPAELPVTTTDRDRLYT